MGLQLNASPTVDITFRNNLTAWLLSFSPQGLFLKKKKVVEVLAMDTPHFCTQRKRVLQMLNGLPLLGKEKAKKSRK